MRIAVNSRGKDEQGNWIDKPNFFDVSVWDRQAETAAQYLAKGRKIGVDGSLTWREWKAEDGGNRQSVEVNARDVYFLDSPKDDGASTSPAQADATPTGTDDDIPF